MDVPRRALAMLQFALLSVSLHAAGATASPPADQVRAARAGLALAKAYFVSAASPDDGGVGCEAAAAWRDCARLYEDCGSRLRRLAAGGGRSIPEARTWLSGVVTSHRTCMDGLLEQGLPPPPVQLAENLTSLLTTALMAYHEKDGSGGAPDVTQAHGGNSTIFDGLLTAWDPSSWKADVVVAKDGSGGYQTINDALAALSHQRRRQNQRTVIYVKAGVYSENVEVGRTLRNMMLVGDGIDKTTVTGSRSVPDGYTTYSSSTFGVSGDGFWARDMTFENTAGPGKHQAVALRASSDLAVFYRCSFRGYQDTLFAHSQRQFYRDCDVYGTVDFIFGNAAAVLQNCNIYVRRPLGHQSNMITAQGRGSPYEATGTSIHRSRVLPAPDFQGAKQSFSSFLGRPWQKYSRVVFMETELDGLVNPKGWAEWSGDFALDTLYYGEYMNTGDGAATAGRVNWRGFHVLKESGEASPFTVGSFIQGEAWIRPSGVPFWGGL